MVGRWLRLRLRSWSWSWLRVALITALFAAAFGVSYSLGALAGVGPTNHIVEGVTHGCPPQGDPGCRGDDRAGDGVRKGRNRTSGGEMGYSWVGIYRLSSPGATLTKQLPCYNQDHCSLTFDTAGVDECKFKTKHQAPGIQRHSHYTNSAINKHYGC